MNNLRVKGDTDAGEDGLRGVCGCGAVDCHGRHRERANEFGEGCDEIATDAKPFPWADADGDGIFTEREAEEDRRTRKTKTVISAVAEGPAAASTLVNSWEHHARMRGKQSQSSFQKDPVLRRVLFINPKDSQ